MVVYSMVEACTVKSISLCENSINQSARRVVRRKGMYSSTSNGIRYQHNLVQYKACCYRNKYNISTSCTEGCTKESQVSAAIEILFGNRSIGKINELP